MHEDSESNFCSALLLENETQLNEKLAEWKLLIMLSKYDCKINDSASKVQLFLQQHFPSHLNASKIFLQ